MANIKDYVKWRGDLDFSSSSFNELDNLVMSNMAYLNIEKLVKFDEEISLLELKQRIAKLQKNKLVVSHKEDGIFFPLVFESPRYKNLKITGYVKELDKQTREQFGAITIIANNYIFISFRGTSQSLVGWKEDFEMSFLDEIPSQKSSIAYLEKIAKKYPDKKIYLGGHSKGGNLAIYSSIFVDDDIRNRIEKIYNNDGPGIKRNIAKLENYKKILPKIITYIPQTSIVGRLLIHDEKVQVITSTQKGMWQHDLYSWQLVGTKFIYQPNTDIKSDKIDYSLTDLLEKMTNEQRKEFINVFFELLEKSNIKTFKDLTQNWYLYIGNLMNSYSQLNEEQKKILVKTFEKLYLSSRQASKQVKQIEKQVQKEEKDNKKIGYVTYSLNNNYEKPKTNQNGFDQTISMVKNAVNKVEPKLENGIGKIYHFFKQL